MKPRLGSLLDKLCLAAVLAFGGLVLARGEAARPGMDSHNPTGNGGDLVARCRLALESTPGLEVGLRQQVSLFDQRLHGTGRYLQRGQGTDRQTRFEMRLAMGNLVSHHLRIHNGRFIVTRFRTPTSNSMARVDIDVARAELGIDEINATTSSVSDAMQMGTGLLALVQGLESEFEFGVPRRERWEEEEVLVVVGRWRPESLRKRFGIDPRAIGDGELGDQIPEPVPTHVELVVGTDPQLPFFPYRIEFLRRTRKGGEIRTVSISRLEMQEIRHQTLPDAEEFQLEADDAVVTDETAAFIARVRSEATLR